MLKRYGAYGAIVALTMPSAMYFEGLKLKAYLDPIGKPTICFGETEGVKLGQTATEPQCEEMLTMKLGYISYRVDALVEPQIPEVVHAAAVDLMYNAGEGEFSKSNMLRHMRASNWRSACKAVATRTYDKNGKCRGFGCGWANGVQFKGLIKRREYWRDKCLAGL